MSLLDPIRPYLALIKTGLFVACVVAAFAYGCQRGKGAGAEDVAAMKTERAQELAEIAGLTAKASEKARAAEQAVAKSFAKLDDQHREELIHANQERDSLRACLLDGSCGLRPQWRCPVPDPTGPAGIAGGNDDAADLRAEGASNLIGNADAADVEVRVWQRRWTALKTEYDAYRKSLERN